MLLTLGCVSDIEDELTPVQVPVPVGNCDTTSVTFSGSIVPLLDLECNECHSSSIRSGNIALEPHSEVLINVNNGLLLCTVRQEAGCSPMPIGSDMLSECEIAMISKWISDGALDN